MKKILLTLASATAMTASAQLANVENAAKANLAFSKVELKTMTAESAIKKSNAPLKSKADGVYYKTPAGSMWMMVPQPFYAYNTPMHVVAPWTDFTYTNMSDKKNGTWGIQVQSDFIDLTEDADLSNNLISSYQGGLSAWYAPQYTEGGVTYIPTHTLRNNSKETMVNYINDVQFCSFSPTNVDGANIYGGGLIDNQNLFGAGSYNGNKILTVETCYPKPMSPLYVEYASVYGVLRDGTKDALSGKTLTMTIYNLENESAEPEVLTCTPEDLILDSEENGSKFYMVNFTKKVQDEISGDMVADPFVIDYPSLVIISGLDQEGVNIGFGGYSQGAEFMSDNDDENYTFNTYIDSETGKPDGLAYEGGVILALGFQSMFDICSVETTVEAQDGNTYPANGIYVSNDGQEFGNYVFSDIKGVLVYTALGWSDEETGEEMYWSDDMYDYDWIQNLVVESTKNSQNREIGYHHVGVVCDPLPADCDKRYAVIHLNGRGVTSEDIYVLQGNITLEEAMADHNAAGIDKVENNGVKANNKVYNLNGQQVGKNYKGIVIENGKKVIKK